MPKNLTGGNRAKSKANKNSNNKDTQLILKNPEEDQEYAKVSKLLGSNMLSLNCADGVSRLGLICGSMRNKVWIVLNDVVLISKRSYQDEKCDVIHKYSAEDVRNLIKSGYLDTNYSGDKLDKEISEETSGFSFEDI